MYDVFFLSLGLLGMLVIWLKVFEWNAWQLFGLIMYIFYDFLPVLTVEFLNKQQLLI